MKTSFRLPLFARVTLALAAATVFSTAPLPAAEPAPTASPAPTTTSLTFPTAGLSLANAGVAPSPAAVSYTHLGLNNRG